MSAGLDRYKAFIDGLVNVAKTLSPLVVSLQRGEKLYAIPTSDHMRRNQFAAQLSEEQRGILADLIQDERQRAIHDVLALICWEKYQISQEGVELDVEPFGTEPYYDFICRLEGDSWPTPDSDGDDGTPFSHVR